MIDFLIFISTLSSIAALITVAAMAGYRYLLRRSEKAFMKRLKDDEAARRAAYERATKGPIRPM